jgi:uncharacterized protein (DUF58 family)
MPPKSPKRGSEDPVPNTEALRAEGRAPLSSQSKHVKRIELGNQRLSQAALSAQYRSRFRGSGMMVKDFRNYQQGDDIRHIDWRQSARAREKMVKVFEEDRNLQIVFAVDTSASMQFGSAEATKFEALCAALAVIGLAASKSSDQVGLVLFSGGIQRVVKPNKGKKHILRLLSVLLSTEPTSRRAQPDEVLLDLEKMVKANSTVILASDMYLQFDRKILKRAARKFDLILLRLLDPRDSELPNVGLLQLEDLETGAVMIVDSSSSRVRELLKQNHIKWDEEFQALSRGSGASVLDMATHEDAVRQILKFCRKRKGKK